MHETNRNNTVRINDRFQILPVFELIVPCWDNPLELLLHSCYRRSLQHLTAYWLDSFTSKERSIRRCSFFRDFTGLG
jgi:hypothetical protein